MQYIASKRAQGEATSAKQEVGGIVQQLRLHVSTLCCYTISTSWTASHNFKNVSISVRPEVHATVFTFKTGWQYPMSVENSSFTAVSQYKPSAIQE